MTPLSDDALHALPGPALLDRTRDLVQARNAVDAELARTVAVAEGKKAFAADGATARSWLKGHTRLSGVAASQVVRNGRAVEQLPVVAAAHAAGELTAEQVAEIAQIVAPKYVALAAAQGVDLAAMEQVFTRLGRVASHKDLETAVHTYLQMLDTDGPEPDPTEERFLTWTRHADGSITGRFHLDPAGAEKFQAATESINQTNRPAGDERSVGQRNADAFVQICDIHLGCGTLPMLRGSKPQVAVQVPLEDLLDPASGKGAATTGFGATLSAARARWAACDADLTRIVLGPNSEPLDHGRTHRLVPPGLRKAVIARDANCVFAGCDAPHWWCEVHHVIHWALDGETSLENSGLLCERHHTQVHHGFTITRDDTGKWHTYRPDGTEILVIRPRPGEDPELSRAG